MNTDILKLIDKDLRTCYVTDKLEVFEKTFCGRVWAFFHPDSLNSYKVASAIDKLMAESGELTKLSVKDRDKLAQNLQNLATRFTLIKDTTRAHRSSTSVFNSLQRLFDQVRTSCNPPLTAGAQRTRARSLRELYPSGDVPVNPPLMAPARPQKESVVPDAQSTARPQVPRAFKGTEQQRAQAQALAAILGESSQSIERNPGRRTVARTDVRPGQEDRTSSEVLFGQGTYGATTEQGTTVVRHNFKEGAALVAQRAKMGLK
jgi:hypothetical protein